LTLKSDILRFQYAWQYFGHTDLSVLEKELDMC
jgi:hypothetical protein